jgi:hypothetical protein
MRLLIAFFGFIALALAPLAAPLAAAVPTKACTAEMAAPHGHHDRMPAEHGKAAMANCCLAVCAATMMPAQGLEKLVSRQLPDFAGASKTFLGLAGEVATPPPRPV